MRDRNVEDAFDAEDVPAYAVSHMKRIRASLVSRLPRRNSARGDDRRKL